MGNAIPGSFTVDRKRFLRRGSSCASEDAMKLRPLTQLTTLLAFAVCTGLQASPIVFQWESNPGQGTQFNGSTLTLASTTTTTPLVLADILAFSIVTPAGTILDTPTYVYSVFTTGIDYSPTALTSPAPGGGQLDIGAYSGYVEIQIAPTDIFESGAQVAGTWSVLGGGAVPDAGTTMTLVALGALGLFGFAALRRKITA
jgi:hypothetical protein